MPTLEELRAQGRAAARPAPPGESRASLPFAILALFGFALGAAGVLLWPGLAPPTPSADLAEFRGVREGQRAFASSSGAASVAAPTAADHAADAEKLAEAADAACFRRAQARDPSRATIAPLASRAASDFEVARHDDELLACLLTEAPARYCASSQRQMITAEIIAYFHGLDRRNGARGRVRGLPADTAASVGAMPAGEAGPDPRVVAAIEARLRDGVLTRADFKRIARSLPLPLRAHLAAVPIGPTPCPPPPWWAFWR